MFGRNLGRGFSGSPVPGVVEESIKMCLEPPMSIGLPEEHLEAIVVIRQRNAFKVLPVYGIDSLLDDDLRSAYKSLKKAYAKSRSQYDVEIHLVVELCRIYGMIVVPTSVVDHVFSYEEFLKQYLLEETA